jgi:hypothetical protein
VGALKKKLGGPVLWVAVTSLLLLVIAAAGIVRFDRGVSDSRVSSVRQSVESAVNNCYALEGRYPPSLEYLEKNYGLIVDEEHFIYGYSVFATNIKPQIYIFKK